MLRLTPSHALKGPLDERTRPGAVVQARGLLTVDLGPPRDPTEIPDGTFGRVIKPVAGGVLVQWEIPGAGNSPHIRATHYTPLGVPLSTLVLVQRASHG